MPKIWFISDTHGKHNELILPAEADIVIHAGDFTNKSGLEEFTSFTEWFRNLPFEYKLVIGGNHDWFCQSNGYYLIKDMFGPTVHFGGAELIEIKGLKIFLSMQTTYQRCPEDIDILVTHEPANCILDEIPPHTRFNPDPYPFHLGSTDLLINIVDRIKPQYHVCGHIHECGGRIERYRQTLFINAAVLDENYKLVRPEGILLDINSK